jgi:hypothetical protein
LGKIRTDSVVIILRSPKSDAASGFEEKPPCLLVLSAKTIYDLGIKDCSSARRTLSNPSTFVHSRSARVAHMWRDRAAEHVMLAANMPRATFTHHIHDASRLRTKAA